MRIVLPLLLALSGPAAAQTTVYYTSTSATSVTVPADYNSTSNTWDCIGGGAGAQWSGGGGGGWARSTNVALTPGATIGIHVGAGGAGAAWNGTAGTGGDSYVCNATANCASIASRPRSAL